ncbi:hypothetical protein S40285_01695 [Stachybotrys chlorohalonatus IBT 40285]|uniref:ubiquitinyl hydrolase 1 n=1 Tax=Stachybotrys chlorohalonatus (strain IBT 40285) TaxID=1283841 RepID=A0A084QDX4_STAC4|nr:hypothetical protein S40285_01695 [Stachybotrys chlorohalonata IBT 40285]
MTSRNSEFETFYEAQGYGHRQSGTRELAWDRFAQPGLVISGLVLLVSIIYSLYGSFLAPDGLVVLLADLLWDGAVFIVPTSLINALDQRSSPPSLMPSSMPASTPSSHAAKSAAMRRILGLDHSNGMMASVLQARTRAFSVTGGALGLKLDSQRPPGLGNRDNSCYQNSILQGLASLSPFPDYLASCLKSIESQDDNKDIAQTLRELISDLNDVSNNGRTLWTPSVLKSMSTWQQQDAQEYYSKMLDDIDKGLAKAMATSRRHQGFENDQSEDELAGSQCSDDSGYHTGRLTGPGAEAKAPRNPLEGLLAQRVACVACGHSDGLSMIPFNCLTLSLDLDKTRYELDDRLSAYTKLEMIEGVECPSCTLLKAKRLLTRLVDLMKEKGSSEQQLQEPMSRLQAVELALEEDNFDDETIKEKCRISAQAKVNSTKSKQIVIARPPQSLAIHMNRSVFNPATFDMIKNSAPVKFPKILDLGPWCLGSAGATDDAAEASDNESETGAEEWHQNPKASMIAGSRSRSRLTGPMYELRAAVTHSGRHENGHYICYRKFPRPARPPQLLPNEDEKQPASTETDDAFDGDPAKSVLEEKARTIEDDAEESKEMDWWRLSDHNVTMVDEETVLGLSPGVFMLFYDCIDPTVVHHDGEGPPTEPKL